MDTIKLLRTQGDLCKLSGDFDDGKLLYDAADTIEVYEKAFEDIRAEIIFITENNGVKSIHRDDVFRIIDKHNPDKVGKGDI